MAKEKRIFLAHASENKPRVKGLYQQLSAVEWHMRQDLAPMLYDDTDREAAETPRDSVVAKARISPAARTKKIKGQTEDGLPVHSFQSLLADLATLTLNKTITPLNDNYELNLFARPTPSQSLTHDRNSSMRHLWAWR